jgi:hypothetical protein
MPGLTIRISKRPDGDAVLTCLRPDGSSTWHRQKGKHAAFFPYHDLAHYAVESTLGLARGFYGLVAEGWDFSDFGSPWPRGPMPADADPAEFLVGLVDIERTGGGDAPIEKVNEEGRRFCAQNGIAKPWREITSDELKRMRTLTSELYARWRALAPGQAMELEFKVPAANQSSAAGPVNPFVKA